MHHLVCQESIKNLFCQCFYCGNIWITDGHFIPCPVCESSDIKCVPIDVFDKRFFINYLSNQGFDYIVERLEVDNE